MTSSKLPIVEVLYSLKYGGSERVGASLARYFHNEGIPTGVIGLYSDLGPMGEELRAAGIPVVAMGDLIVRGRPVPLLFRRRLEGFMRRFPGAALHVHHGLCLGLLHRFLPRLDPSKVVLTEHAIEPFERMAWYRRAVARWSQRHADSITVLHSAMHAYFVNDMGLPRERIITIPNGVAVPANVAAGPLRGSRDTLRMIWVGRIDRDKDLPCLIEAMRRAQGRTRKRLELKLVGDGDDRAMLEASVRNKGLEASIEFLGFRGDVERLMLDSDVFVMSSINEGMPMVILEAMAAGLPCISTDAGGIGDCVDSEVGKLVPAGQPDALADAIVEIADDDQKIAALGRNAFARAGARFSLDRSARKYIELLIGGRSVERRRSVEHELSEPAV